jgi:hypothetical protein
LSVHLAEAIGSNLALVNQLSKRFDTLLDGNIRVDARGLKEIDELEAVEQGEAFVYGGSNLLWTGGW